MAANCARRSLQFSCTTARTILSRSSSSSSTSGFTSTATKLRGHSSFLRPKVKWSRNPVELSAVQSLMPLHTVTASALFTSLLSVQNTNWGCLSEGLATPL